MELNDERGEPEGPVILGAHIVEGGHEHEDVDQDDEGIKRNQDQISD